MPVKGSSLISQEYLLNQGVKQRLRILDCGIKGFKCRVSGVSSKREIVIEHQASQIRNPKSAIYNKQLLTLLACRA
jgi:hypothetical protein